MMKNTFLTYSCFLLIISLFMSCSTSDKKSFQTSFENYDQYPTTDESLWLNYSSDRTVFKLWAPTAEDVRINFFNSGNGDTKTSSELLQREENGVWKLTQPGDLDGMYYTFETMINGLWQPETPGVYAQAVGVNGNRAMVIDLENTNPEGWKNDQISKIEKPNEAIIYELHIRDITSHQNSGSSLSGKYLGLVETGTKYQELTTGIDHIIDLGITHVHLLPAYDHYSIDETKLDSPQFNWGYDPQNYNVPEGSFSSDPYNAAVRIKEFKQMVLAFHNNGIGVILDVVYNHTGRTEESNFNREVPGYYYRQNEDGSWSNASGCGNETASDRPMIKLLMKESMLFWAIEYHLDVFRFDLMGIHDIETMNEIAEAIKEVDPSIFIYGEGWTAGGSPLPDERKAIKRNTFKMPHISAFSDDLRDGIKGSVFDEESTGFVSGAADMEESIKFGVVGSINHPQINYQAVNYSDSAWTNEPWQAVSYVSCHDNHTLFDKLGISRPDATSEQIADMHKLANAIVLTSQGISFLHAGVEMMRTKGGEHNSYNKPDEINSIDWNWKVENSNIFNYYKSLIELRKKHPAFYMPTAKMIRDNLKFGKKSPGIISFEIAGEASNDEWSKILVVYNANPKPISFHLTEKWRLAVLGNEMNTEGIRSIKNSVAIPAISMMIAFQK
jgi:pullulanase